MNEREELDALRRLAELEAKASGANIVDQDARERAAYEAALAEMSPTEKRLAGTGKFFVDTANRAKQIFTGNSDKVQKEIDDAKRTSQALVADPNGLAGNVVGATVATLPTALIPGVNTWTGSALLGGALGASQPVASDESTLKNTLFGATGGVAGKAIGTGAEALYRGGKALIEPWFKKGSEKIVGRTLTRMAGDRADDVIRYARNPSQLVPGSRPTLAEATQDPALAGFQLAAKNANPDTKQLLTNQEIANNKARQAVVNSIAKDETALKAAVDARKSLTEPLYEAAQKKKVMGDEKLKELLSRPSLSKAWSRAEDLAKEKGISLTIGKNAPSSTSGTGVLDASGKEITRNVPSQNAEYTGRSLQYLKMGLDDLTKNPERFGLGAHEVSAISSTKKELNKWLEDSLPEYLQANKAFTDASKPINQMQVGQYLKDKLNPALMDFTETPTRLKAESFAKALRDGDITAQRATGFDGARIDNILTPDQSNSLKGVGSDLARKANAEDIAKTLGSTTTQNLATQNLTRQLLSPLGVPDSALDSSLIKTLASPFELAFRIPERQSAEILGKAFADPNYAAQLMQSVKPQDRQLIEALLKSSPVLGAAVANGGQ